MPIFRHGPSEAKSRPSTFPKASPAGPLYELYPWQSVSRRMPRLSPISHIILSAVLPAMRAPRSARRHIATRRRPHPFGVLENASLAASHGPGLVGLPGWASA